MAQQQVGETTTPGGNLTRSWDLDELMFDSHGNLLEGELATDLLHVFKLYGTHRFGFALNVGVDPVCRQRHADQQGRRGRGPSRARPSSTAVAREAARTS